MGRGVAVREFPLKSGHGYADYLLYVNGRAVGVVEAKKAATTLTGVEVQAEKYAAGMPDELPAPHRPPPFLYQSTGIETRFTNRFDTQPRSRRVFSFHKPETIAEWLATAPSTLRGRLWAMPAVIEQGLRPAQLKAVKNLEASLADDRPRALIQMATGSGKTYTAVRLSVREVRGGQAGSVSGRSWESGTAGTQTVPDV